jgi:hypothetical protein
MNAASDLPIEVEVEREIQGGFRLKVSVPLLGMYMWGFRATISNRNKSSWWVQAPATKTPQGIWKFNPEFDKSLPFWLAIEKAVIKTVENQKPTMSRDYVIGPDEEVSDKLIEQGLNDVFNN